MLSEMFVPHKKWGEFLQQLRRLQVGSNATSHVIIQPLFSQQVFRTHLKRLDVNHAFLEQAFQRFTDWVAQHAAQEFG